MTSSYNRQCVSKDCNNYCDSELSMRCKLCRERFKQNSIERRMSKPVESNDLFEKDFVLNVGDINVTSQNDKIVIAKRTGNAYNVVCEMDIEQALAIGIAIRSVATCAKYSKG